MLIIRIVLLTLVTGVVHAHHSAATVYDVTSTVEIKGVVKDFQFRSPHSFIVLEVANADGSSKPWKIEAHSVPTLRRAGFDRNTFKPGDVITVFARPNRNPNNPLVFGFRFITQDGTELGQRPKSGVTGPTGPVNRKATALDRLSGRWMTALTKGPSETPLPLTTAGRTAWENFDPKLSPANKCIPATVPAIFYAPYLYEIQFGVDAVTLTNEVYNVVRVVPLNAQPRKSEATGLFGMVSGRMDGEALVLASSEYPALAWGLAIAAGGNGAGADVPSSLQKSVIERYTASNDGKTLRLEYTVEDPVYLTRPYSSSVEFTRVPDDSPMYPFDCDVESAELYLSEPSGTNDR